MIQRWISINRHPAHFSHQASWRREETIRTTANAIPHWSPPGLAGPSGVSRLHMFHHLASHRPWQYCSVGSMLLDQTRACEMSRMIQAKRSGPSSIARITIAPLCPAPGGLTLASTEPCPASDIGQQTDSTRWAAGAIEPPHLLTQGAPPRQEDSAIK